MGASQSSSSLYRKAETYVTQKIHESIGNTTTVVIQVSYKNKPQVVYEYRTSAEYEAEFERIIKELILTAKDIVTIAIYSKNDIVDAAGVIKNPKGKLHQLVHDDNFRNKILKLMEASKLNMKEKEVNIALYFNHFSTSESDFGKYVDTLVDVCKIVKCKAYFFLGPTRYDRDSSKTPFFRNKIDKVNGGDVLIHA